jgi:hypothetical protein
MEERMHIILISLLFIFVSCSTTKHIVHVDPVNEKRFLHDQKIKAGMTHKEVMLMFGSPDEAMEAHYIKAASIKWVYYRKMFCAHQSDRCYVTFDRENRVIDHFNFRMEVSNRYVNLRD